MNLSLPLVRLLYQQSGQELSSKVVLQFTSSRSAYAIPIIATLQRATPLKFVYRVLCHNGPRCYAKEEDSSEFINQLTMFHGSLKLMK